mmetsp:Transcript_1312/g.4292  ORF Transcript_1312/g.4292 Transcript_1312/m.4292 type:complete len:101 (-) Transcript_1312:81-383(-)
MRTTSLPGKYRRYNAAKKGVRAKDVAAAAPALKVKQIGGAKNGGKRTVLPKSAKYYPADDERSHKRQCGPLRSLASTAGTTPQRRACAPRMWRRRRPRSR